jgi:hypothetical protein
MLFQEIGYQGVPFLCGRTFILRCSEYHFLPRKDNPWPR